MVNNLAKSLKSEYEEYSASLICTYFKHSVISWAKSLRSKYSHIVMDIE